MFIGRYYHKLEAKNRASVPAKFREKLGNNGVITKGLDGCLFLFDQETWNTKMNEISQLSQTKRAHRDYVRFLTNDAQEIEIDGQGRLLITDELKVRGQLVKDIVFVGSYDHVEIWDQKTYHEYVDKLESEIESQVETIEMS